MMDWLISLWDMRHDFPVVWRSVKIFCVVVIVLVLLMTAPSNLLFRTIGVTDVQRRVSACFLWGYWSLRALVHVSEPEKKSNVRTLYGTLEGIDRQGKVVVTVAVQDKWERCSFVMANLRINDLYGVARAVGALRYENVRIDLYENEAVIWVYGAPLNVRLIEEGVAEPHPHPPSDIFDKVFAAYYWFVLKTGNVGAV